MARCTDRRPQRDRHQRISVQPAARRAGAHLRPTRLAEKAPRTLGGALLLMCRRVVGHQTDVMIARGGACRQAKDVPGDADDGAPDRPSVHEAACPDEVSLPGAGGRRRERRDCPKQICNMEAHQRESRSRARPAPRWHRPWEAAAGRGGRRGDHWDGGSTRPRARSPSLPESSGRCSMTSWCASRRACPCSCTPVSTPSLATGP